MRKKINYKGRVQGVGFRWNTEKAVERFDVTGYVKNLPNGSVEVLLEGCSEEVLKAENSVEERMRGYLTEKKVRNCQVIIIGKNLKSTIEVGTSVD